MRTRTRPLGRPTSEIRTAWRRVRFAFLVPTRITALRARRGRCRVSARRLVQRILVLPRGAAAVRSQPASVIFTGPSLVTSRPASQPTRAREESIVSAEAFVVVIARRLALAVRGAVPQVIVRR